MWRGFLAVVLLLWAGAAAACPAFGNKDKHLFFSARQLVEPKVAEVRAGGTVLLEGCETLPGVGNVSFEPSVAIHYRADGRRMDLEFRTSGRCDTILLVRAPSGRWFFDGGGGGGLGARLRLATPREGRYEIWVGSRGGEACPARLTLQTFRTNVRYARAPAWAPG